MNAYLIDPKAHNIDLVDLPDDNRAMLDAMRQLIGCGAMDHVTISDEHDAIWVADEGMMCGRCWAWKLKMQHDPLAGPGIIIGADDRGITRAPVIPLWMIHRDIQWLDEIIPEVHTVAEPFGMRAVVTWKKAP
jgi:hypothetical protein